MEFNDRKIGPPTRERGQVFVVTACCMLGILAMSAWVIDIGNLFSCYQQLVAATQAAALAGVDQMKQDYMQGKASSTAFGVAQQYSAIASSGGLNAHGGLQNVQMVSGFPKWLQLGGCPNTPSATAQFPDNLPCNTFAAGTAYDGVVTPATLSTSTTGGANGIVVGQQATVPMFFARIFGLKSLTITAYATAVPGRPAPFDMIVIADSTASMNTSDPDATCTASRINCVKLGIQQLLTVLSPGSGNLQGYLNDPLTTEPARNLAQPSEEVALFTFPGLLTNASNYKSYSASVPIEYCGASGTPSIGMYDSVAGGTVDTVSPQSGSSPYYPPTYSIVPLSSDYLSSGSLNPNSNLVKAIGTTASGTLYSGCPGLQAIGGAGTFYAGVIAQAQAALVANPRSSVTATGASNYSVCSTTSACAQNVIVLVSDGMANATNPYNNRANMIGYTPNTPGAAGFPNVQTSTSRECYQSVQAAQAAAEVGTDFYAVSYGGETSGCTTDTGSYASPCYAMSQMASSPSTPGDSRFFFADVTASQSGCTSITNPVQGLVNIFRQIALGLATGRLVPNGIQ